MSTSQEQEPWDAGGLRFGCTRCGNCCTGPTGYVWVSDAEVRALAEWLQVTETVFRRRYTHRVRGRLSLNERHTEHGYDCVFLDRDPQGRALCGVYAVRPMQCRTWPFWRENLRDRRAWDEAAGRCPGMGKGKLYPPDQIRVLRDKTP